jgi:hypothetical protein
LGGASRLKILRLLLQNPNYTFTRYEIGKTVLNGPVSIRNNLNTHVQINWVTPFHVHHLSKYVVNLEHEVVIQAS